MKQKERLDKIMLERGLVKSRERAKALVMAGRVSVDGQSVSKGGALFDIDAEISLAEPDIPFVSRGGVKLASALDHFGILVEGKTALDVGCSTGGFTDCILKRGAVKVYAVDVGYGQFDWNLRHDQKVVLFEKTNFRHIEATAIPEPVDIVLIDVSFISLLKILPRAVEFMSKTGILLALIKPQFEVGKKDVGKGGIVRNEVPRIYSVRNISEGAKELGLEVLGIFEVPLRGQKGNVEYFLYARRN